MCRGGNSAYIFDPQQWVLSLQDNWEYWEPIQIPYFKPTYEFLERSERDQIVTILKTERAEQDKIVFKIPPHKTEDEVIKALAEINKKRIFEFEQPS